MLFFLLFVVMATKGSDAEYCYDHAPAGAVDGCSIPGDLPFFFKQYFTPACNKHDVCYDCASYFGHDRAYCDTTFHNRMNSMCDHLTKRFLLPGHLSKAVECKASSWTYYEAVHLAASSHFRSQPASYCKESWVAACI